ncbi:MAG TPA: hypothetical protein PKL70_17695 [Saprospiraceae bacterium]|nr:hypothetical protein [Saprospiraceae bacterium]
MGLLIWLMGFSLSGTMQAAGRPWTGPVDTLPVVFSIGQYSDEAEKLNLSHISLMEVCNDEVLLAYDKWLHMLAELNDEAADFGLDLKGTKFWFSVYWHHTGRIKHFAYYPKPGSKPIDYKVFEDLLSHFIDSYTLPVSSPEDFYNYGSAAFPIPSYRKPVARQN